MVEKEVVLLVKIEGDPPNTGGRRTDKQESGGRE